MPDPNLLPYAYALTFIDRDNPPCFPTLDAVVAHLIERKYLPHFVLYHSPIEARYANGNVETVSIKDYLEEIPIDIASIEREIDNRRAESLSDYEKTYPTPEDKAYHNSHRYSGSGWYHEDDREQQIEQTINARKWKWKQISSP